MASSLFIVTVWGAVKTVKVYFFNCSMKVFLKQNIVRYCKVEEMHETKMRNNWKVMGLKMFILSQLYIGLLADF
jgi:hypothetical protein